MRDDTVSTDGPVPVIALWSGVLALMVSFALDMGDLGCGAARSGGLQRAPPPVGAVVVSSTPACTAAPHGASQVTAADQPDPEAMALEDLYDLGGQVSAADGQLEQLLLPQHAQSR